MGCTCEAPAKPGDIGGRRCGREAMYQTPLGRRCDGCAELLREMMRSPNMLANVLLGRVRTEDEIRALFVPIS